VSQAIRMLAAANRISATSAIVTRPQWMREAAALKPLAGDIAIGLHLNLTLGAPLSADWAATRSGGFPGIAALIASTHLGRPTPAVIANEIECQLDAFEAGMGAPPDIIDGHEHVHILPRVRASLLASLKRRYARRPILIRDPSVSWAHILGRKVPVTKSLVLRFLARGMRADIERSGFISNDRFAGITRFEAKAASVDSDFAAAAELEGWRPLAMCHPGFADAELQRVDRHTKRRQLEFDALMANSPLAAASWRPKRRADGLIAWPGSNMENPA
jgi:predicted glycoside hydrolase/deacetylase ChbG (UPF0249 family)